MDDYITVLKEGEIGSRPSWDEFHMANAILYSKRSSCHNVHSGTVITTGNYAIAHGYNGAPPKIKKNCLETGCRKEKKGLEYSASLGSGTCIGNHSEMNALGYLNKLEVEKLTMYTTIFSCHSCAKNTLAYDIKKVVFKQPYQSSEFENTLDLFKEAGVPVVQLDLSPQRFFDILALGEGTKIDVWTPEQREFFKSIKPQTF